MKAIIATLLLAASVAAAPVIVNIDDLVTINPEDLRSPRFPIMGFKEGDRGVDKREAEAIAPVAAGIFGIAAGTIANAIATGATKGLTSGSVRNTIERIFGRGERSVSDERLAKREAEAIAPVAAGIFGLAAGTIANAIATGATKGLTSGSIRNTIERIFGRGKRSVPAGEDSWTFEDVVERFATQAVEDLYTDEATPEEAAVCVSIAYEIGGNDTLVREAQSVQLSSKADGTTVDFDCFLLAAPLNFTVPADQVNATTVAVKPGPGTWKNGVLSF
ncbi:Hypothetical predicted protein [Lecanosticta acicola]|uniref:DUF7888 domain-containing protein n=1 Tax=Lecanosticta acicola TaxID=111012 RepID=A0AAI8Z1V6_9PEZI|nr:Hypothetical predicted protein [Lecanosticta acicola]